MAVQLKNAIAIVALLLCFLSGPNFSVSAQNHRAVTYYTPLHVRKSCILRTMIVLATDHIHTTRFRSPANLAASVCFGFDVEGTMIAAASEELWNDGAACGQRFEVTCLGGTNQGIPMLCLGTGTVTVRIVDRCLAPACWGTIDLSWEAFALIADPNSGDINISFQQYVEILISIHAQLHRSFRNRVFAQSLLLVCGSN